tara:strand:- start:77 stop:883 length:807 start_codon:yes stop_codon:yes gene_type:complete
MDINFVAIGTASTSTTNSGYIETTTTETVVGYEVIPLCRPKFIFFKFTGLRPETPHWIFFDGKSVNQWINTTYTYEDYNDETRTSTMKNPGDKYIDATTFPTDLGGSTSEPFVTGVDGVLEGAFYLQSNDTTAFNAGTRELLAIDLSILDKNNSTSYGIGQYSAAGAQQVYTAVSTSIDKTPAPVVVAPVATGGDNGGSDNGTDTSIIYSYSYSNNGTTTYVNVYDWNTVKPTSGNNSSDELKSNYTSEKSSGGYTPSSGGTFQGWWG